MARAEIGEVVLARSGGVVAGASVQVNERGAGAATVYLAETGGTTVSNPLTTDSSGRIEGWLETGSYDLVVSGGGITSYTQAFEAVSGASTGIGGGIAITEGGSLGATYTLDLSDTVEDHVVLIGTLTDNCVITLTNRRKCLVELLLTQDGTGSRTVEVSDGTTSEEATVSATAGATTRVDLTLPDATTIYVHPYGGAAGADGAPIFVPNTQTASYTPVIGDAGKAIELNSASDTVLTVPPNASVAFATGTVLKPRRLGTGEVDIVPGSGVTIRAAEDLRRLRVRYSAAELIKRATNEWSLSGDLIAVPAFDPLSLSPVLFYAADAITGLVDGDPVGTWPDLSTSALDATQVTGGFKPLYKTSIIGGLPVVRFDGSDDTLATASTTLALWQDLSIFIVTNSTTAFKTLIGKENAGVSGEMVYLYGAGTKPELDRPFVASGALATTPVSVASVIDVVVNGTSVSHFINGAANGTDTLVNGVSRNRPIYIGSNGGSSQFLNGDVAEIIVYNTALSTSDRRAVEAYLGAKYGIAVV